MPKTTLHRLSLLIVSAIEPVSQLSCVCVGFKKETECVTNKRVKLGRRQGSAARCLSERGIEDESHITKQNKT
jgi:hypothetical protein